MYMSISIPESTLEKFTTFGDFLKFLRRRVGITQMELSIAVGYSDAQISRLEQNLRMPDIPTIQARFIPALDLQDEPKAVNRLLDLAANVRREDAPGLGICPYKGLNHFDESDADLFVGREDLTSKLSDRILFITSDGAPKRTRFLAVIGASGSGKSSLVRAGLIPALRWNKKSADWQTHVFTPTAHPLESLATTLTQDNQSVTQTATLMDDMAGDSRSLHLFAKRKLDTGNNSHILLVVDQFEETFSLCRSEKEKASFIGNLLTAASETDGPIILLIAMRADFYAYCANYIQLREVLAVNQEYIGAMSDDELRRAIEEPAQRGRWEFEPGLVKLLLHDVGHEPGALPLLSHALMETWQRRRNRVMTLSGYTSTGGVHGAIAETAEAVFVDQFTREQKLTARRIFLRLTELGDETSTGDTRRRATLSELILKTEETNSTQTVLKVLADARLIITNEDSVEVAHEALIREWPTLRGWLEDNREGLRLHQHLIEAAQEWDTQTREPDLCYRGARLLQAQEWATTHADEMNTLEHEFLDASIAWAQQEAAEREAQRQRELKAAQQLAESEKQRAEEQTGFARQLSKRAIYLTGAFVVALLMAFTALYFGSQARQTAVTAQSDKRIATSRELAAASLNNLSVDPERSILLALQSVLTTRSVDGTMLPESLDALHRSIITSQVRMTLKGHDTSALSVAYSPDGSRLASIDYGGTVIVWNAATGEELLRLPGTSELNDFVTAKRITYSPDGKLLIACDRNQVNIYDPESGSLLKTLIGHEAYVTSITISTDGELIASGGLDGSVIVWDISTSNPLFRLDAHTDAIEELTFSPDGKLLVTTGADAAMRIWDVASGNMLQEYTDFTGGVTTATFSPDGTQLAFSDSALHVWQLRLDDTKTVNTIITQEIFTIEAASPVSFSPDGRAIVGRGGNGIKLWDAITGRELLYLTGLKSVNGLAFSSDGKSLASTSGDGTIKIWSMSPGSEKVTVSAPGAEFGTRVVYNLNQKEILTNGGDGTATVWNAETGESLLTVHGHDLEVINVAFSLDGKRFATGSLDETAIVWDAISGQKLFTLPAHEFGVRDIVFSPNGDLIATGGFDRTAKLWNANTGALIFEITEHQGLVLGVAFSPDEAHLATSSTDATAKIWDVKTGGLIFTLTGHTDGVRDVAYSPDGTIIATASGDGTTMLWDAATGSKSMTLIGHSSGVFSVEFSPNGKFLATGSGDNTAKIWDVESGQEILTLPGSQGGVLGAAFSPSDDGAHLAVSSADGIVRIFLLQIDELLALAQTRATRPLTLEECQQYLHVDACPTSP
jgi:WD40 repeat protein